MYDVRTYVRKRYNLVFHGARVHARYYVRYISISLSVSDSCLRNRSSNITHVNTHEHTHLVPYHSLLRLLRITFLFRSAAEALNKQYPVFLNSFQTDSFFVLCSRAGKRQKAPFKGFQTHYSTFALGYKRIPYDSKMNILKISLQ